MAKGLVVAYTKTLVGGVECPGTIDHAFPAQSSFANVSPCCSFNYPHHARIGGDHFVHSFLVTIDNNNIGGSSNISSSYKNNNNNNNKPAENRSWMCVP